jgi:hypothetical protein
MEGPVIKCIRAGSYGSTTRRGVTRRSLATLLEWAFSVSVVDRVCDGTTGWDGIPAVALYNVMYIQVGLSHPGDTHQDDRP